MDKVKAITLTRDEEKELIEKIRCDRNDIKSREILILSVYRYAVKHIRERLWNLDDETQKDLIQEAVLGIDGAIDTFDPDKGKFTTHAMFGVRKAINEYMTYRMATVRKPDYVIRATGAVDFQYCYIDDPDEIKLTEQCNREHEEHIIHQMKIVNDCMDTTLNDKEREIFVLYYDQNSTQHEIGRELGYSHTYVANKLKVCIKKIRDCLKCIEKNVK